MEYASFLAGERWTDHPQCTHPLLGGVARAVNDHISDAARPGLVGLIPSVIGLNGDDPRVDAGIAIRCAAMALPVVAEYRQRALAAGLISARRVVSEVQNEEPSEIDLAGVLSEAEAALSRVPQATRWAEDFTTGSQLSSRALQRRSAPCMVRVAVVGIAEACISDRDALLNDLLTAVVADCTGWLGSQSNQPLRHDLVAGATL